MMRVFFELLKREFALFWNNSVLRILFIGAPIMYGVLLGYVYNKGKVTDLPIVVVDKDQSKMSKKALQMMEDNEVLTISALLPNEDNLTRTALEKEAVCIVIIPEGFEKVTMEEFQEKMGG